MLHIPKPVGEITFEGQEIVLKGVEIELDKGTNISKGTTFKIEQK